MTREDSRSNGKGWARAWGVVLLAGAGLDQRAFLRHYTDLEDCFCELECETRDQFVEAVALAVLGQD